MRKLVLLVWIVQAFHARPLLAQEAPNPKSPPSERHEFVIANFKTESGVTFPKATVVYGTYGHLNAAKDNVSFSPRTTWPTITVTNG